MVVVEEEGERVGAVCVAVVRAQNKKENKKEKKKKKRRRRMRGRNLYVYLGVILRLCVNRWLCKPYM